MHYGKNVSRFRELSRAKIFPATQFFPDIFMQQTATQRTAKILKFRLTYLLSAPYFFKLHYSYLAKMSLNFCVRILVKMKLK